MVSVIKHEVHETMEPLDLPSVQFESSSWNPSVIRTYVVHGPLASIQVQTEVVDFASKWFKRRWSDDFIATRGPIVEKYRQRSVYVREEAHDSTPGTEWQDTDPEKLKGTVALTYSQTKQEGNHLNQARDFLSNPIYKDQHLPMEDTLGISVPRYYDRSGQSLVVELRTYAKHPSAEQEFNTSFKLGQKLRADLFTLAMASVRDYPDLYEKPIFYTYGDKISLRMYRELGFEVDESVTPHDRPIQYKNQDWWVLRVTPKRFEENFFRLAGARTISHLNQDHPVVLPNGLKTFAAAGTSLQIDDEGLATFLYPAREIEVAPGFFVSGPPAHIVFSKDGNLERLDNLSRPYSKIPAGSDVEFYPSEPPNSQYRIKKITLKAKPMEINGVGTAYWSVTYSIDGKVTQIDSRPVQDDGEKK
jgi:hypothetical protein